MAAKKTATKKSKAAPKFVGGEPVDRPLADYKPNSWNPNRVTADERKALRAVLQSIGWVRSQAMLVWATDEKGKKQNIIVDGQHRWEEATKLGFTVGPVVELHRTKRADAIAWTFRIDKIRGTFDDKAAASVLDAEFGLFNGRAETIDVGLRLGFSPREVVDLSKYVPRPSAGGAGEDVEGDGAGDVDEVPQLPKKTIVQPGDVWELGGHRLLCGDSFRDEQRSVVFPSEVDAIITDPPYAIYGSSTGLGADIADDKMVRPFFAQLSAVARSLVREFGHVYVCCDWRSYPSLWDGAQRAGLSPKNCLVWDKGGGGLGSNYANAYELVGYFARSPPATAMKSTTKKGHRQIHASNILRFPRVSGAERLHNAAKPVDMIRALIVNSTDSGDVVADLFSGSGSVIMAAEREGRRCHAVELEPRWIDVTIQRWEKLSGGKAKRIVG